MRIRQLVLEDVMVFWNLRLEGLKQAPEAFSSSYEEAVKLSREQIESRIGDGGPEQINLAVVTSNESARHLYKALGFEVFGLERKAVKVAGEYYDEEFMVLNLRK